MSKFVIKHSERQHHHHHQHHHHLLHCHQFYTILHRSLIGKPGSIVALKSTPTRKKGCEKGPSHDFVLELNITQGRLHFHFSEVPLYNFSLNPISHLGLQRCTSFSLFLQRHRYVHNCNQQTKEKFEISFAPGLTEFQGNLKGGRSITTLQIFSVQEERDKVCQETYP